MGKTSFIDKHFGAIAIIVFVGLALWWGSGQTWDFSKFSLGNLISLSVYNQLGSGNQTTPPPQIINTETFSLCQAYAPTYDAIVAAGYPHPSVACTTGGGTWLCDASHAGCYNYLGNINCAGAIYTMSAFSCNSYHATFTCDVHNAYCQY